ncbi:DinB family protein [Chloroflexota bacterium]
MEELIEYRKRMIGRFAEAHEKISQAMSRFPDPNVRLEKEGWNIHQIIAHIRDVNREVYLPRLRRIMAEEDPVFENFDGEDWMLNHYDPRESLDAIMAEFGEQCQTTADWLMELAPKSWNRSGSHPTIGTHTLQWWVERTLAHIIEHNHQLEELSAKS